MSHPALRASFETKVVETTSVPALLELLPELEEEWDARHEATFASTSDKWEDAELLPYLQRLALEVYPLYLDC